MSYSIFQVDFSYLAKEPSFRSDTTYISNDIFVTKDEYYRFDELFEIVNNDGVDVQELGEFDYAEISDVTQTEDVYPVHLSMDDQNELNANYFKKINKGDIIKVKKNDILISKVRPYLKKILFIDDSNVDIYYTSAFIHLRPLKNPQILYYLLKGHFIDYLNSISRQGKGYPTLSDKDLHLMKFNKADIDLVFSHETEIIDKITPSCCRIAELKSKRISDIDIINTTFQNFFKWDIESFNNKKSIKTFYTNLNTISENYDLRFSAKFHRPAGAFVIQDISKKPNKKISRYLVEPIELGASVSPSDFDKDGEYYYISMATVKNNSIELDETQLLSKKYVDVPKNNKKKVNKGDIIMTRSGVAIGKFALVKDEIKAIHSDFTMRIRLHNINLSYAYYYFRSIYFQYLIEINYKGLQNNNIFPNQVQELPIPDISSKEQKSIVESIENAIKLQEVYQKEIITLREQINTLIEMACIPASV